MNVWYAFLNALGIRMFEMDFMKNALLAVLLLGPLFGPLLENCLSDETLPC